MASLQTLRAKLERKIGTLVSTNFTDDKKKDALNEASERLRDRIDINTELIECPETLSFNSGRGELPEDYVYSPKEKLYVSRVEDGYRHVSLDRFDTNESRTWTIDTDGSMQIYPADSISLIFRYATRQTDMAEDADDNGLPEELTNVHAMLGAYIILFDHQQYEVAQQIKIEYNTQLKYAQAKLRKRQGQTRQSGFDNILQSSFGFRRHLTRN